MRKLPTRVPMDERFWSKVDVGNGCWLWTGAIASTGYGVIRAPRNGEQPGILIGAHRYSLLLHTGPVDSRLMALHHCDVRACVRHDHLYWGDHVQNARDMVARGRWFNRHTGRHETREAGRCHTPHLPLPHSDRRA